MGLHREEFSDGKVPDCIFMSREMFERLLRRLVLGYSKRIKTKIATATGINTVPGNPMTITSVTVRAADGIEEKIPAALVIGILALL